MWTSGGVERGERGELREARGEKETEEMRKCEESEEIVMREREQRELQRGELRGRQEDR